MVFAIAPKYVGKIWPTGKFGVSRLREAPFLPLVESQPETEETRWNKALNKTHGILAVLEYQGKLESVLHPDLSNVSKSPLKKRRGTKGISRHGRNLISSAAVITERNHDRRLLTFGTVTLPSASADELLAAAQNWSAIVKQFVKNLTRGLHKAGLLPTVFGVTEIQMKRFEKHGVPALHLHFVFLGRSSRRSAWQVSRHDIRRWWTKSISKYFHPDTNYSSVENVQQVKKSAASYLGKYMSKGEGAIASLIEQGFEAWIPSAWFTISHDLRREVLHNVMRGEKVGELLNWLCHNVISSYLKWVAPININRSDGSQFAVGFAGTLSKLGLDKIRSLVY